MDGSFNALTFAGIPSYPGLIQNGQYNVSGKSNLTVRNMNLVNSGSALNRVISAAKVSATAAGWFLSR